MQRIVVVESLQGERVAEIREDINGEPVLNSTDPEATTAIEELIRRGRGPGLICLQNQHQRTDQGQIYRTCGCWSKPGDPNFLDALADGLAEFNLFAYVVELVGT